MEVKPTSTSSAAYGSGGGYYESGRGGGRIIIQSLNSFVFINETAVLLAEGTAAAMSGYGAGSGGSISVLGKEIQGRGLLSVQGGVSRSVKSGAGGGGRITMQVSISCLRWLCI